MGAGVAAAGVAGSGESTLVGQGVAAVGGGGWVRHGMELDGLDTLWEIVLNATGETDTTHVGARAACLDPGGSNGGVRQSLLIISGLDTIGSKLFVWRLPVCNWVVR